MSGRDGMNDLIGTWNAERKTCGPDHLPGCYNPNSRDTWCLCGQQRWPGQVGTWHSCALHEVTVNRFGRSDYRIVGWDVYFLHAAGCTDQTVPHLCGASA